MRIARPWALELEYTRDMMMALLLRPRAAVAAQRAADRTRRRVADQVPLPQPAARGADGGRDRRRGRRRRHAVLQAAGRSAAALDRDRGRPRVRGGDRSRIRPHPRRRLRREVPRRDAGYAAVLLRLPRAPDRARRSGDELPESPAAASRRASSGWSDAFSTARLRAAALLGGNIIARGRDRRAGRRVARGPQGGRARAEARHGAQPACRRWRGSPGCRRDCPIASRCDRGPRGRRPQAGSAASTSPRWASIGSTRGSRPRKRR